MIEISERLLSESELRHLRHDSSFSLLKNPEENWRKELDRSVAEILDVEVLRAWQVNICTCCPNSYLFQVSAETYLFIESWTFTKYAIAAGEFPRQRLKVERLPLSKKIVALAIDGEFLPAEELQLALTNLPDCGIPNAKYFRQDNFRRNCGLSW